MRYIVDWDAALGSLPTLMLFSLPGVYIGETALPIIPTTMASFDLSDCGIISPLPPTLLNQSITDTSVW